VSIQLRYKGSSVVIDINAVYETLLTSARYLLHLEPSIQCAGIEYGAGPERI